MVRKERCDDCAEVCSVDDNRPSAAELSFELGHRSVTSECCIGVLYRSVCCILFVVLSFVYVVGGVGVSQGRIVQLNRMVLSHYYTVLFLYSTIMPYYYIVLLYCAGDVVINHDYPDLHTVGPRLSRKSLHKRRLGHGLDVVFGINNLRKF